LIDVPEWPELERLKFEKEALDFYISSHPLAQFEDQLRRYRTHSALDATKAANGTTVLLAGMIVSLQLRTAQKSGKRWAMFQLEDFTGQAKCILWSETFEAYKSEIVDDKISLFEGTVEWRDGGTNGDIIIKKLISMEQARRDMTRGLLLRVPLSDDIESLNRIDTIGNMLRSARGSCPVYLSFRDPAGKGIQFKVGTDFYVDPSKVNVEPLEMLLGPGSVVFTR
jgi:DNA polymerase III subunit alpha